MNSADLFHDFNSLPDDLKKEVADFIAFLKQKAEKKQSEKVPANRPFGFMKGKIKMSEDFDEPLEDFKEYM